MTVVKFKSTGSEIFENYVDIGFCERYYYALNIYTQNGEFESYQSWFDLFQDELPGVQMISINYYLLQYNDWNGLETKPDLETFSKCFGDKITEVITKNFELIKHFHDQWFAHQSNFFLGLDLGWHGGINEEISNRKESEDGEVLQEITFKDGSCLKFLDNDDTICSFYVKEIEYPHLIKGLNEVINKFR